ncbi:hypothetical protein G6M87_10805 [Rhizobium rhizogenes]|uniref:hypothetical protein n=1 Tax=Rhizobium rhizogenes TaxID=359 RepID=UPI00157306F9|nr:hypothetical protein [Rhizobium rhizogenes]NTI22346.1 hypothetical protein [Rhizobium rhizogenes]QTG05934.1 hypothetical protein G6M87_10805 [Rhizobium rhizogenes]
MKHSSQIDTREFGLALAFDTRVKRGHIEVRFDTGIIMLIPNGPLFDTMVFHLQEADPKPPQAGAPRR